MESTSKHYARPDVARVMHETRMLSLVRGLPTSTDSYPQPQSPLP